MKWCIERPPGFVYGTWNVLPLQRAYFVAHNVNFDYNFIRYEFERLGLVNLFKETIVHRKIEQEGISGLTSYSLAT